jgi:hypothetical protein
MNCGEFNVSSVSVVMLWQSTRGRNAMEIGRPESFVALECGAPLDEKRRRCK